MVKATYTAAEIDDLVKVMAEILSANDIAVDKIILYGSYAKGTPRAHSDVDIAVISPSFRGKKLIEIQAMLARAFSKYLSIVEAVGYSPQEFESAAPETMIGEIKRTGKILYAA